MKNVADIYALSPMQELMLFHAKTTEHTDDVLFNQIVYEIKGGLDTDAYRRAWQLMVDRHSALRTLFVWQDGKDPLQVVREQVALPWAEHDWRELSATEQEQELDQLLAADRAKGFDLLQAPLMRINLVRLDDRDYWLVWSSHHLIIDRWCIGILFGELKDAYEAYNASALPPLAPAPRYSDYIAWLARQDKIELHAYWNAVLRDTQARPLALRSATEDVSAVVDSVEIMLEGDDWAKLRQFALDKNLTPSTLIIATWALILGTATGVDDSILGLTVSGRPAGLARVEQTVGCFINNVPLRVALDRDRPLTDWLQEVQEDQLSLKSYEYASIAQIQSWSGLKTKGPLFDTLLVLQSPVQVAEPADLTVRFYRGGMQTGYPISLGAIPAKDSLRLVLSYDQQRVPEELIEQMVSSLQRILLAMPDEEGVLVGDILALVEIDAPIVQNIQFSEESVQEVQSFVPSGTGTEQALAQIWAEVLNQPGVNIEDRFFEMGGDSIKALHLFTLVKQRLGKDLPISILFGDPSVAQMARAITENGSDPPEDPVLVPLNLKGTRPPVFFTHGFFGSLMWLTNLLPLLGFEQPAYGLQALGLHPNSEPDRSIEAMATRYMEAIRRVQPTGPYYLGGFCFGGIIAYEIARQMEQLGERTALLAIIDGFPPGESRRKRPLYDPLRLEIIRESAPHWIEGYEQFGGWRIGERIMYKLGLGPPPSVDVNIDVNGRPEFAYLADFAATESETRHQIREINRQAARNYKPQAYSGEVTLFSARILSIGHAIFGPVDPQRGWGNLAKGGVSIRPVEGSHVGLLTKPFVSDLAAKLNDALRSAMRVNQ